MVSKSDINCNKDDVNCSFILNVYNKFTIKKKVETMAAKATKIDLLLGELYKRIKEGFYPPGERLPSERKICGELKVSRDTVRGAIRRLQEENLVDIVPKGGAYVKSENLKMTIGDIKASHKY